jgi:Siphovirus protein of unknown function (DUF859)
MATYSAAASGSGPFYVDLTVTNTSQDIGDNTSRVHWALYARLATSGWATWSGDSQSWSVNIGGAVRSGLWILDFRPGTAKSILIAQGDVDITHNSDGTKTFTSSGTLSTNHSSFGSGTASGSMTLPRIPRGPRVLYQGTWRNTVAYVRVNGSWVTAVPYVRVSGTWRIAGG